MAQDVGPLRLLVVQPTPFCNIDCSYCYLPGRTTRGRLATETFTRLLRLVFASPLSRAGFRLVLHGGEPLAAGADHVDALLSLIARENRDAVPVEIGVQTNATLVDADWIELFRRHEIRVGVSIDGPRALHDTHRRARNGAGSFDAALRGVERLRDAGIAFDVIAVVTRATLAHGDTLLAFFAGIGARSVGFNVEEIEAAHATSSLSAPGVAQEVDAFWRALLDSAARLERPLPLREVDETLLRIRHGGERFDDQHVPLKIVTCDWQGRLSTFSPELIGTSSPRHADFVFGDVAALARLEDMVAHPALRAAAAEIAHGVAACRRCAWFAACGGGAPANKLAEHGTLAAAETLFCRYAIQAPCRAVLDQLAPAAALASE